MNTKQTIKFIAILVACSVFYVLGGYNAKTSINRTNDTTTAQIEQMQRICNAEFHDSVQSGVDNGFSDNCESKIKQVSTNGFEVLRDSSGNFYAEYKGK